MNIQQSARIQEHIEILRCPVTKEPLQIMSSSLLDECNKRIESKNLIHFDGTPVSKKMSFALVNHSQKYAYEVLEDIFILLDQKAIVLEPSADPVYTSTDEIKSQVQDFYEHEGWKKDEREIFGDTAQFEDLRDVSRPYIHQCHVRLEKFLKSRGKYFLDVASGPIPYTEHLHYSRSFEYRICVDLSLLALQEAKKKIGESGLFVLGDVTNLPFRDHIADAVVSLHTVYHVPAEQQENAFLEIYRVLSPGSTAVVVYSWGNHPLFLRALLMPVYLLRYLPGPAKRFLKKKVVRDLNMEQEIFRDSKQPVLYAHHFDYPWFQHKKWPFKYEIRSWRSVNLPFLKYYVHNWLLGKQLLSLLFRLEGWFPGWFGRFGQYPMIVIYK